ncbi:hypothetical protein HY025_02955 [Candidatus Daviesbacteria bacterium]|nr:hypothetical protein [Candidatus Daviesbacteria bacterium]
MDRSPETSKTEGNLAAIIEGAADRADRARTLGFIDPKSEIELNQARARLNDIQSKLPAGLDIDAIRTHMVRASTRPPIQPLDELRQFTDTPRRRPDK